MRDTRVVNPHSPASTTSWSGPIRAATPFVDCVDQAMVDYLTELITPPAGTVCQSDQQPFDPDFR